MRPFTLDTTRFELSPLTAADIDAVYHYCQDPLFEKFLTIPWPYTQADADFFVTVFAPQGWTTRTELLWGIREHGALLGVVSLRLKQGRYDIGYWLGAEHRGREIMPEAVSAVIDWAFSSEFVADEIGWECVVGNHGSVAVARKVGYTYTGEAPATIPARDGTHPASWHAVLRRSDTREPKPGWPAT